MKEIIHLFFIARKIRYANRSAPCHANGREGFTLIEMAIVLIVIGLIIGAVLKGQDLIDNARGKRLASFLRQAEVAVWTHLDRMGYFPGDSTNRNGVLDTNDTFYADISNANITNFSSELPLGSSTFVVTVDMYASGAASYPVLCIIKKTGEAFTTSEKIYGQMVDTAIDGVSDSDSGKILARNGCLEPSVGGLANCGGTLPTGWGPDQTINGLCYLFDSGSVAY